MLNVNTLLVVREDRVRAVPLMHVEVDDRGALDPAVALQRADGDGDVVEYAEAFAVIRKGVVRSAGEIHRDPVLDRVARRLDRAARGAVRSLDERLGPGESEPPLFVAGQLLRA